MKALSRGSLELGVLYHHLIASPTFSKQSTEYEGQATQYLGRPIYARWKRA